MQLADHGQNILSTQVSFLVPCFLWAHS